MTNSLLKGTVATKITKNSHTIEVQVEALTHLDVRQRNVFDWMHDMVNQSNFPLVVRGTKVTTLITVNYPKIHSITELEKVLLLEKRTPENIGYLFFICSQVRAIIDMKGDIGARRDIFPFVALGSPCIMNDEVWYPSAVLDSHNLSLRCRLVKQCDLFDPVQGYKFLVS
jgi:hypothetical protein